MKKFFKILMFMFLLSIHMNSYSKIKEIMTIEDYSKQFLDENFILDDLKEEENEKISKEDIKEINGNLFVEDKNENLEKVNNNPEKKIDEQIDEEDIPEEKYEKELTEIVSQEDTKDIKKVEWNLPDNFRAAIIGDLNGNIFYSKNADKIYPLASITKIMTLIVTFDEIKAGRISLRDKVKISRNSAKQGGSRIPLKTGQILRLEDLIKASAIYSANNATYAIAEYVGKGSISRFVRKMNKKVEELGLQKDLKYFTPAGLPTRMTKEPMDSGTARAIYKLAIEALKYKKYIQIAGIKNTTINSGKIKLRNRNHLLGKEGVYGIKTGYHKEAKYNIAIASKTDNMDIIVVVMGGNTYTTRDKTVLDILDTFKNNYETVTILNKQKTIGKVKILNKKIYVPVVPDKNYKTALKKSQKYRIEIKQRENIKLNVYKGEDLGEYIVYIDDKILTRGRILAQRAVKR